MTTTKANQKNAYKKISLDTIERVRQIDLLTYMQTYEPDNLARIGAKTYKTREHDSLKISNGKWFWWSRGFGGVSALDYLIKVRDIKFTDAVQLLAGSGIEYMPHISEKVREPEEKKLQLPKRNRNCNRVIQYLKNRGIDEALICECIRTGLLYESAKYHNVVFVGKDEHGIPQYAACRGTQAGSKFKGDVSGSNKNFSFRLASAKHSDSVHLFEAAIDLLSYATYLASEGQDYHKEDLLSLSGVYQPNDPGEMKIPIALEHFLKQHTNTQKIYLHLDNDKAGRSSAQAIATALKDKYQVIDCHPVTGKDVNDFLLTFLKSKRKERNKILTEWESEIG